MNTDRSHDDAAAYALGALAPHDAERFERHLQQCSDCRDQLASYGPVLRALETLDVPGPATVPRPVRTFSWARPAAVAAAFAVFVGGAFAGGVLRGHADDRSDVAVSGMLADPLQDVRADRSSEHLRVLVGRRGERTAVVVAGLPALRSGRIHQVWVDGRSMGVLQRTASGSELLVVPGDRVAGARRIGISDEPAPGSPARTTPALIAVQVSRD